MSRTSMATLITRVRFMVGDPVVAVCNMAIAPSVLDSGSARSRRKVSRTWMSLSAPATFAMSSSAMFCGQAAIVCSMSTWAMRH